MMTSYQFKSSMDRLGKHLSDGVYVDSSGAKAWIRGDKYHREDGPAIIYDETRERIKSKTKLYYLNGIQIFLHTESDDPKIKKLQDYMKTEEILE